MRVLLTNLIDTCTLSSEPPMLTELPINNVKKISKSRVARCTSNSVNILGKLINISSISGFIIGRHNFLEGTQYQLTLYSDYEWTNVIYNTELLTVSNEEAAIDTGDFQYNLSIWFDLIPSVSSFKLSIANSQSNPMDYLQIGRLFIGKYLETSVGISLGHNLYWKENTIQYRTESGSLRSDIYTPSKVIEFSLDGIMESERANLQRSFAEIGRRDDFFISLFPDNCNTLREQNYSGIVKLTKIPRYSEFAPNIYKAKYVVEEV